MCGIAGWAGNSSIFDSGLALQLQDSMQSRGPDDRGALYLSAKGAVSRECLADCTAGALVHTRLSILDLTSHASQPMSSTDGRFHLTYNGEIYNYLELRQELESLGHQFRTQSDTEVLLVAYSEWGKAVLDKLTGMFAFAIFDVNTQQLFVARDPFGIKPLFYSIAGDVFSFASDIATMFCFPNVSRRINAQRAYEYLALGLVDYGDASFFADIKQLPAAHYLIVDVTSGSVLENKRYWQAKTDKSLDIGFSEATEKLRELFLESVELHLRSDVKVGACLSGGVDSSAIVGAIRHLNPNADLHTFTYVADDAQLSEEKWADIAGKDAGATMHKVSAGINDLVADLDHLIRLQGEPFTSTSIYAQYRVFNLAQEAGMKVMLDGQGADEIFAGYKGYQCSRLAQIVKEGRPIDAWRFYKATTSWPGRSSSFILGGAGSFFLPKSLRSIARNLVGMSLSPKWLSDDWLTRQGVEMKRDPLLAPNSNYFSGALQNALETNSVPCLLRYEDRNSMAHSIESRVPFLNRSIVDFAYSLPDSYLIDNEGRSKAILREAMRGIMPDVLIDRRDKIGFETPESKWLSAITPWVESTLSTAGDIPVFEVDALNKAWQEVKSGKVSFSFRIWRWLNFLRWSQIYNVQFD